MPTYVPPHPRTRISNKSHAYLGGVSAGGLKNNVFNFVVVIILLCGPRLRFVSFVFQDWA